MSRTMSIEDSRIDPGHTLEETSLNSGTEAQAPDLNTSFKATPLEVDCYPVCGVVGPYGLIPAFNDDPIAAHYIQLNEPGTIQVRGIIPVLSRDSKEVQPLADRARALAAKGKSPEYIFSDLSALAATKGIVCKPLFQLGKESEHYKH
jgi:hypothetical protein